MKINIIGGGPAGLYFGILMKLTDAKNEIHIYERNGPDDTFGWGVVFSHATLNNLRQYDERSYDAIVHRFATWDNVDVVHRDERITIHGNKFAGLARIDMLHLLQERANELGVRIHFRHEVLNVSELSSADLLVGADGVNSRIRDLYKDRFLPELSTRTNRYIWYGTKQLFNALTLTFRENENGIFAAHSYKFNQDTSTFIIESDEATWQAAGFQDMTEETQRKYLEHVFRHDLGGHELLSNNSKWLNFLLVKNRHWYFDNIVLLGDALHTAHFSIGSGTKLALEDAIALAESFKLHRDVPSALNDFEHKRKPVIEAYQSAAYTSLTFFENLNDYAHLDPTHFAYKLMTRSGRVDMEKLRKRDPEFVDRYEQARKEKAG